MNVRKSVGILLLLTLSALLLCGCGGGGGPLRKLEITPPPAVTTYTVTFDLGEGTLVSGELVQNVENGGKAVAPEASRAGYTLSWDKDFSNISSDMEVQAVWTREIMDAPDLAEYVQARTVTVHVKSITGGEGSGSGFFIDDQGTLITNNHVISGGSAITVETENGASYNVSSIIQFSSICDLAVLKVDISGNEYLEFAPDPVRTGEQVYAVGSALGTYTGTFTAGTVSATNRKVGLIECVQMDAAISHGNSGGPLVNQRAQVVGINSYSASGGQSLNLAIKPEMLESSLMGPERNFTVSDYTEWYKRESTLSYSPVDDDGDYYYSTTHRYEIETGAACVSSIDFVDDEISEESGFHDCFPCYTYAYDHNLYDQYVNYLKSVGFVYDAELSESATDNYYVNVMEDEVMNLYITTNQETLMIFPEEA